MDVADLVDLVAAARVAAEDALPIVEDAILALDAEGVAMDAKEDVLDLVKGVGDLAMGAVGAPDLVKGAQDALDAEDLVLVHVHRKERVRLVPHAIVVLAVLVRVLHVHLVEDVLDQVDAEEIVLDAMLAAPDLVKLLASTIAVGAKDLVNRNAQLDVTAVLVVLEDAPDVQEDVVLDVTAHVLEIATDVVTAVVDNVKTHVLLTAQQRVLVHVKLKHLELKDLGIQIRYDKKNSEILFDLSNGLTVVDNTIFKQLGYKLPIPLFVMLNDSNITYNPNHDGSSDNYWPQTIENANGLVINAGQGYQIMVSPNETTQANKKCTRFDLIWYKYNTTKNYPEVGSIFKGSKVIRIPFKITGI